MKWVTCVGLVGAMSFAVHAEVVVKEVDYKAGDTSLKGYLAYDDAQRSKSPGILVIPEWWGNTQYPRDRARQLAELGYIAFAADMYGDGKTTDDPKEAGEWAGAVKNNPEIAKVRLEAGLDQLKGQEMVDSSKLAAIGYCFGGSMVLNMARWHMPVKGVVSFHGDLTPPKQKASSIDTKILVATGDADSFVPPEQVKAFEEEMKSANADVKVLHYADAHHAFTNPHADEHHMDNVKYNEKADKESWEAMKEFFAALFPQK